MIGGANEAFYKVLTEAGKTRDVQAALRKYGSALSQEERNALQSLTREDLQSLQTINNKLAPLGVNIAMVTD
jgi:hypothetical protein